MRLQKYLALCGAASRRQGETLMRAGRVSVNGVPVTEMGAQVAEGDVVMLDGRVLTPEAEKRYILYHKPAGEVSTASDPQGRPTVLDRFRDFPVRLYPVGRLDFDSEGLLLLTNDGDLTQRMLHPSREVDKTYLVRAIGEVTIDAVRTLRRGVEIDGQLTSPADIRIIRQLPGETVLLMTIHEGRNRQVRRMMTHVGYRVGMLRRVQFGPLQLGTLARGEWRELTADEREWVKSL